jgi:hypothetical protein
MVHIPMAFKTPAIHASIETTHRALQFKIVRQRASPGAISPAPVGSEPYADEAGSPQPINNSDLFARGKRKGAVRGSPKVIAMLQDYVPVVCHLICKPKLSSENSAQTQLLTLKGHCPTNFTLDTCVCIPLLRHSRLTGTRLSYWTQTFWAISRCPSETLERSLFFNPQTGSL